MKLIAVPIIRTLHLLNVRRKQMKGFLMIWQVLHKTSAYIDRLDNLYKYMLYNILEVNLGAIFKYHIGLISKLNEYLKTVGI